MTKAIENKDFRAIDETDRLILGMVWEKIYLIDKKDPAEFFLGEFDAMSDNGIIDKNNRWAVIGREVIFVWRNGKTYTIKKDELACVEEIKVIDDNLVELDVDTTNVNGNKSIWTLNTLTHELNKVS